MKDKLTLTNHDVVMLDNTSYMVLHVGERSLILRPVTAASEGIRIKSDIFLQKSIDSHQMYFEETEKQSQPTSKEQIKQTIAELQKQLELLEKKELELAYGLLHDFRNWDQGWGALLSKKQENVDQFALHISQKYNITKK